jgi:hypothetical protein
MSQRHIAVAVAVVALFVAEDRYSDLTAMSAPHDLDHDRVRAVLANQELPVLDAPQRRKSQPSPVVQASRHAAYCCIVEGDVEHHYLEFFRAPYQFFLAAKILIELI